MATLGLSHLRLHLVPETLLRLPAHNKGNSLRGGFGSAFRKLVCVDLRWECAACSLRFTCPYTTVFNPFIPPDAPQFSGNQNIPRPFVFKPPLDENTQYAPGQALIFDLVVIGAAVDYLPYFIVAFRELGASGFGLNRARVRLDRVDALCPEGETATVYDAASNLVRPGPPVQLPLPAGGEDARHENESLTLEFLTPTSLKAGSTAEREGALVRRPEFHHVLKRLRDRLNALATFHGSGPLALDFKALGKTAELVETVADHTSWVERTRFSRRRAVPHDLSGFVGRITFRGALARFLPFLAIGQYVHVGKNAVFGNGWFRIAGS
jgi:hypothetical protein